jgi:threonine synthase
MDKPSPYFSNLKCRECGKLYPKEAIHVCDFDFGPLEAAYDYDAIGEVLTRQAIESRPQSMWRYRELLPIDGEPTVGMQVGFTPLVKADRLARELGVREVYVKNDTVNYPTLSFKDRGCPSRSAVRASWASRSWHVRAPAISPTPSRRTRRAQG